MKRSKKIILICIVATLCAAFLLNGCAGLKAAFAPTPEPTPEIPLEEQIDAIMQKLIANFEEKLGAKLR